MSSKKSEIKELLDNVQGNKFLKARDKTMTYVFFSCAFFSIVALASICVFLFSSGIPFIARIGVFDFLFSSEWDLASNPSKYGILSMILSSVYVTILSTAIGTTLGLFTAIALYKFCPQKLIGSIRQMINLLAGIPSVLYGLFGMLVIVPFLRDYISPTGVGYGILSASLVLAIMILPTIVSVSLDSLNAVPKTYYEAALALGATKEQSVFKVLVPAAKNGIYAAIVLSIGRAIGETMAVIMVIGGATQIPTGLFQSVRTLTANIAMGATEVSGDDATALIASGVVLFAFTLILNIVFTIIKEKKGKDNAKLKKKK